MLEITTHYRLFKLSLLVMICFYVITVVTFKSLQINFVDILVGVLYTIGIIGIIFNSQLFKLANEKFICYLIMLQLFCIFRCCSQWILNIAIPILIVLFFLIETVIGFQQFYISWQENSNSSLAVCGSFQNSGIYAIFLVICLPMCYYLIRLLDDNYSFAQFSFVLIVLLVGLLLFITRSRTAAVVLLFYILLITRANFLVNEGCQKIGNRLYKTLLVLTVLVIGLLTFLKPASSQGRIFVWKVSCMQVPKLFPVGIGLGHFSIEYPKWQVKYVKNAGHLPEKYFLNSDETHVAMNEYLELFIELGAFGYLGMVLIFVYLFKGSWKTTFIVSSCRLMLMLIMVASFFSYPLHCNIITMILTFSCCILATNKAGLFKIDIRGNKRFYLAAFIFVLPLIVCAWKVSAQANTIAKWDRMREDVSLTASNSVYSYRAIYPSLKDNGKFMLDYGERLLNDHQLKEAVQVLNSSKKYYYSYRTLLSTADAYYQSGDLKNAIENLEDLSALVPYKFYPKYLLTKLYFKFGNKEKGKEMAHIILGMPVKILSSDVLSMREEIERLLKNNL